MAFGAGSSQNELRSDINVTPLVDVCLVLLIIFMVVTPMLQQGVDVLLPEGKRSEQKGGSQADLLVSVRQDGSVFVGETWIADQNLASYLAAERARDPQRVLILKADRRLEFSRVRAVMRAATEAKFSRVAILTENPASARGK